MVFCAHFRVTSGRWLVEEEQVRLFSLATRHLPLVTRRPLGCGSAALPRYPRGNESFVPVLNIRALGFEFVSDFVLRIWDFKAERRLVS
jgi:hypothetical protein